MNNYKELEDNLKSMIIKEPFSWQKFVERVIRWNYLAGNKSHDRSDEKYDNQLRLVREEFKEVLEEIKNKDIGALKSELIDLVVVSSYAMFLQGCETFSMNPFYGRSISAVAPMILDFTDPREAYQFAVTTLNRLGDFEETAKEVLDKNDKKIPLVKDFVDVAVATFWQLDKYDPNPCSCPISQAIRYQILAIEADGRYTGVNATIIDLEGNQYIVFKDSNDKVMKPVTFY